MPNVATIVSPQAPAPESSPEAIVFENVAISFEDRPVLDGISFTLQRGESKILLGVAGVGKSTILKLALGLIKPDHGRILVLGHEVTRLSEEELFAVRRQVGMVFQESALFDSLTVRDNVAYRLMEEHKIADEEIERRVQEALRFVELENTLDLMPSELSGGMRRRVAIARALVTQPEVILYDSPTGGLDPVTSTTIIELIVKQRDVYHTSSLLVTHRLQDAFVMASHYFNPQTGSMQPISADCKVNVHTTFLLLRDGKIVFNGSAGEMVTSADPFIKEYLS